ncbi:tRNA glutamyl-Q(34) synthetase GluQRS [Roseovarius sp. LXJ103]|uniref:tRNA glutamyl-Q(34) synthetase GluQRS n=1 Tax=Roseovarius carneus TaxID=2853164 RepID=UPI000D605D24|nr:tRNA glutamyl-Q(34) synthetase GluQRS [Roseovarius carneus]MBZ8119454.1 tRNA glutamyl-Q(34) synthetase GluQRS [Roseovarius carneus]PWE34910.1 tRNA glutamyl-Q(34) synthetase GluQRS [Pelagicola sp. LXJ1103]
MTFTTRFAPSPTGPLHLGHAYSALLAHDMARAEGGRFLLRIDDLDQTRSRPDWEALILEDLRWLGIDWDGPIRRQSEHFDDYRRAIESLAEQGAVYPCRCTRADIAAAASAPQEGAPGFGPDGRIYPGTCRARPFASRTPTDALRLDLTKNTTGAMPAFTEMGPAHGGLHEVTAQHLATHVGDPVIARPGLAASYHFAVVLDDAATQVTHVIRGEDLFEATFLQCSLQQQLGLPPVTYHHHALIRDEAGKRLAKRDNARAISKYRADGATPEDVRRMAGLP